VAQTLENIRRVREGGLKAHKKVYHRTLSQILDAHPKEHMPPAGRLLLEWMAEDHGSKLTAVAYSRLLQCCRTREDLLPLLADLDAAQHKSNTLAVDLIEAYLRTVKHARSSREAASGDSAWAVVNLLDEMHNAGVRIDSVTALKLLRYLCDVKLRTCAERVYRMLNTNPAFTPSKSILQSLIALSATDSWERREFRTGEAGKDLWRYWPKANLRRREHHRETQGAAWKASRHAAQLWMELATQYHGKGKAAHPTEYAHDVLLLAACKRGDLMAMRQGHAMLAGRYSANATSARTRTLLLKGCVVAGDPAEVRFFFWQNLHPMPLVATPARLKLLQAYDQWHSSRVSTFLTCSHCNLRPNTLKALAYMDWFDVRGFVILRARIWCSRIRLSHTWVGCSRYTCDLSSTHLSAVHVLIILRPSFGASQHCRHRSLSLIVS
jgi:hypothetical protein